MAKSKTESGSPNEIVRIEDALRDLRSALHAGYTHLELRDAVLRHPIQGPVPASDIIHPSGI